LVLASTTLAEQARSMTTKVGAADATSKYISQAMAP
jgi:hypothetical protein